MNDQVSTINGVSGAMTEAQLFESAKALLEEGQTAASQEAFQRLSTVPAYKAVAIYGMGVTQLAAGQIDEADSLFHQALALDRSNANAHFQLGLIAERRGQVAEARSHTPASHPAHSWNRSASMLEGAAGRAVCALAGRTERLP